MSPKNLTALNAVWLTAIIVIIIALTNLNGKINQLALDIKAVNEKKSTEINPNNGNFASEQTFEPATVSSPKDSAETELKITDSGFSPAKLEIDANKINVISITNSGKNSCSFEVKDLDIVIDLIAPGEIMDLVIGQEFSESKNYDFFCSCGAEDGDPQIFTGVLAVTK